MSDASPTTMLIAYDGSPESSHALEFAARLLSPKEVEIITVWEPLHRQAARHHGAHEMMVPVGTTSDKPSENAAFSAAQTTCQQGVELAKSLGLVARGYLVESSSAVWSAIVEAARELSPDVIVTGSRGIAGFQSLLKTSTSDNVLHHSGLPVFVVPPVVGEQD